MENQTIENLKQQQETISLDTNRDYLKEAREVNSTDTKKQAELVLSAALNKSTSNSGNTICQEVYNSCVENSKSIGLEGVWTLSKVYGSNSQIWFCSGGIYFVTDQKTRGGQYIAASFVNTTTPQPNAKVK